MEEKLQKLIEELKKNLDEQQNGLNEIRNQIINLEKELNPQIFLEDTKKVAEETLEEARNILIGEFVLEVDLSARAANALCRAGLANLQELYNLGLRDFGYRTIRNIGSKSAEEIRNKAADIPQLVSRIKERRHNIDKYDQPLVLLAPEIAKEIPKKYKVTTLKELYKNYTEERTLYNYCLNELAVKELLRRY